MRTAAPLPFGSVAPRRRVTIKDVAAATGLSPAAVSYAMRGLQTSPETQERVRRAADDLGYTGNAVARALARGRTGLVGVLSGSLEDLGEQRFVEALGRQLGAHELQMMLVDAQGDPEREGARAPARRPARRRPRRLPARTPPIPSGRRSATALPVVTVGDALSGRPWARCSSTTAPA